MADDDDREMDLGGFADADAVDAVKRPGKPRRGRPKGSLNRKTQAFEEWYQAQGYRDPLQAMAQFISVDPVALQSWFIEHERTKKAVGKRALQAVPSLFEIIKEMHTAASQLAPYLHGKKPIEIAVQDERLPWLYVDLSTNQLQEGRTIEGRKTLSIGQPIGEAVANEINDLEDDQ